jgi:hypothetical protein
VENGSTIETLRKVRDDLMGDHRFAVITFEHDIYRGDLFNTRAESRSILEGKGYVRVFSDVMNDALPFEDWYVHPDLVDMDYVRKIQRSESIDWKKIVAIMDSV